MVGSLETGLLKLGYYIGVPVSLYLITPGVVFLCQFRNRLDARMDEY